MTTVSELTSQNEQFADYRRSLPPAYPSSEDHARAWAMLAANIAKEEDKIAQYSDCPPETPGELIVIGSGIETVGFLLGDEELLRGADDVFFCVADPATVVWIKSIRPDALDLYVLYDDSKVRYTTYMQMAEAMLYPVRHGRKVVAIYYGHPGIFVLSTHRSIAIARREGHRATMRSNVSALDCLCSDLGVDPCHPGMQTHEATDMLIRGRLPDTNLHVVLWQVGLIGEMGFRRKGYLNSNFSILIEYLQKHYGEDYPMTHYVASRYPTIPPLIETYPLSEFHNPNIASRVTGISTVYLAPRDNAQADRQMLERLGMIKPGQEVKTSSGPLREIAKYTARERKAFRAFRDFSIPKGYHWQQDTAGGRFLIALRQDPNLQTLYTENPADAVDKICSDASATDRRLLVGRDAGGIQIAAKGTRETHTSNRIFYQDLLRNKKLQQSLMSLIASARGQDMMKSLNAWGPGFSYEVDWRRLRLDMEAAQRNHFYPWAGIYFTPDTSNKASQHILILSSTAKRSRLWLDGKPVRKFTLRHGVLEWKASLGETHHGFLRIDHDIRGRRRFLGSIWPQGETIPATYNTILTEVPTPASRPSSVIGLYHNAARPNDLLEIKLGRYVDEENVGRLKVQVYLNSELLEGVVQFEQSLLKVGSQTFPLLLGSSNSFVTGEGWMPDKLLAPDYFGTYKIRSGNASWTFEVSANGVLIDSVTPGTLIFTRNSVEWSDGPNAARKGLFRFMLDPVTLHPVLFGNSDTAQLSGVTCFAVAPVAQDVRIDTTALGLPTTLGDLLTRIAILPANARLLLWDMAEKTNRGSLLAVHVLARHLP